MVTDPTTQRPGAPSATLLDEEAVARADRFIAALVAMKRRLSADLPDDLGEEAAACTPNQLDALHHVVHSGGLTMHDLARAQGIAVSTATALADRLLRQELVDRAGDPSDRRVVRLVPTDRGRRFVERYGVHKRAGVAALLAGLTPADADRLVDLMTRLVSASEEQS